MYQSFPQTVYTKQESAMPKIAKTKDSCSKKNPPRLSFSKLETDDILLLGLLLILLTEETDDWIPLLLVAYLLFF